METVTIHKAKTELSRLIKRACRGEEIVIARGKTPVAKLVPVHKTTQERVPGLWKGLVTYTPDAFDPLTDQELKDLGFE
jgi:prevent-host-death family protein